MKPRLACVYVWHWPSETPVAVLTWTCWSDEVSLKNDEVYFLSPCPSLCVSLSVCVSVCFSLCTLSLSPSLSPFVCLCLFISVCLSLSVYSLCVCMSLSVSLCLCTLSVCLYFFVSLCLCTFCLCTFCLCTFCLCTLSLSVCMFLSVYSLCLSFSLSPFLSFSLSLLSLSLSLYIYNQSGTLWLFVLFSQDKLYSGSHNAIDVWETSGSFQSLGKIDHECGSVHSLAVTKMFIIAGNSGGHNWVWLSLNCSLLQVSWVWIFGFFGGLPPSCLWLVCSFVC